MLTNETYTDILKRINRIIVDQEQRSSFKEILRIIKDYREKEECFINKPTDDFGLDGESNVKQYLSTNEHTYTEMDVRFVHNSYCNIQICNIQWT